MTDELPHDCSGSKTSWRSTSSSSNYGLALDAGDFDAYAALFAEDGEVLLGPMGRAKGRDEIKALMTKTLSGGVGSSFHIISSPQVQLDRDAATSQVMWSVVTRAERGSCDPHDDRTPSRRPRARERSMGRSHVGAVSSTSRRPCRDRTRRPHDDVPGRPRLRPPRAVDGPRPLPRAHPGCANDGPVFYLPDLDHYIVTRYDDIERVLLDRDTCSAANASSPAEPRLPGGARGAEHRVQARPPR